MAEVLECTTERVEELGESLTVLDYDSRKWLIGVQVAASLNRETFNMYRSMKVKNIDLTRAAPAHVDWLIRKGVVKSGTHSVTLIPYDAGLAFIHNVISTGGLTTSVLPKKIKKSSKSVEGGGKRPREPSAMITHHLTPTSDRLAAAATRMQSTSGSGGNLSLDEEEDEEDSDDFSDDVVQPTKRRRTAPSRSSAIRRPSPRRTTRSTESPLATRSPSYNLSSAPRYPTSLVNARFMPTQATIPTLPDDDDEIRATRRVRRWPSTTSIARKESSTVHQPAGPRRPLHISRRKQAPWQVMRAVQQEDCVPFKFRDRMEDGDGADEEPSLAAALLHSFMRAMA